MKPIRLGILGLGPIGLAVAEKAGQARDFVVVAAADSAPGMAGRKLNDLTQGAVAIDIAPSLEAMLTTPIDVAILCSGSRLQNLEREIGLIAARGASVVATAEELACPRRTHPDIARRLHELAHWSGVRVVGTGVNPGFVLDLLPVVMASAAIRVDELIARRVVDSNTRRPGLRVKTGCGLDEKAFRKGVRNGGLRHVGLDGSAYLIAEALGWELEVTEQIEPVITTEPVETAEGTLAVGRVAGVRQIVTGATADGKTLRLELVIAAGAGEPHDHIELHGEPPLSLHIEGGAQGELATVARLFHAARVVRACPPGLLTVLDLPPAPSVRT